MNEEKDKVTQPEVGEIPKNPHSKNPHQQEPFRDGEHGFMDDHQCNDDYGLNTRMDLQ